MINKVAKGLLALTIVGGLSVTAYAVSPWTDYSAGNGIRSEVCAQSGETAYCQLTDEQKTELLEKAKQRLSQSLADGKITQEQYDKAMSAIEEGRLPFRNKIGLGRKVKSNLTDEQKAALIEKAKERLSQKLADGEITQEQYDKAMSAIEEGKLPLRNKDKSDIGGRNKNRTGTEQSSQES